MYLCLFMCTRACHGDRFHTCARYISSVPWPGIVLGNSLGEDFREDFRGEFYGKLHKVSAGVERILGSADFGQIAPTESQETLIKPVGSLIFCRKGYAFELPKSQETLWKPMETCYSEAAEGTNAVKLDPPEKVSRRFSWEGPT